MATKRKKRKAAKRRAPAKRRAVKRKAPRQVKRKAPVKRAAKRRTARRNPRRAKSAAYCVEVRKAGIWRCVATHRTQAAAEAAARIIWNATGAWVRVTKQ